MNKMIQSIEEIHKNDICIFKMGSFYHTYGRDAYILSYLFGYKIKAADIEKDWKECGFPSCSLSKVMANLEDKKLNYIVMDRRNNYDVDEKMNFGNLNRYTETYEKAKKFINYKARIDNIVEFLVGNIEKQNFLDVLNKVEEVVTNERRKI